MTRESRLSREIAWQTGMDIRHCINVLRAAAQAIHNEWVQGRPVHFPGIGTIQPAYRKPRIVISNLEDRRGRRYPVPSRVTARLIPEPRFKCEGIDFHERRKALLGERPDWLFMPDPITTFEEARNPYLQSKLRPQYARSRPPRSPRTKKPSKMPWEKPPRKSWLPPEILAEILRSALPAD